MEGEEAGDDEGEQDEQAERVGDEAQEKGCKAHQQQTDQYAQDGVNALHRVRRYWLRNNNMGLRLTTARVPQ